MRRKDRELNDIEHIEAILRQCDIAHIAMMDEQGWPYCVPVNFGYTMENTELTLYFHGALQGKKADLLRTNPRVSVCIYRNFGIVASDTACGFGITFESVMAFGHACIVQSEQVRQQGLKAIMAKVSDVDLPYDQQILSRTAVFAVKVEQFTAKQIG